MVIFCISLKLPLMFIPKFSRLFNSIPRTVNHTNPIFFNILQILFAHSFFPKGTQHNSFVFLLLIFDCAKQSESFHLFACTFFTVALLKVNHEERYLFLRLLDFLPFAISYFLLLLKLLVLFLVFLMVMYMHFL